MLIRRSILSRFNFSTFHDGAARKQTPQANPAAMKRYADVTAIFLQTTWRPADTTNKGFWASVASAELVITTH